MLALLTTNLRRHAASPHVLVLPTMKLKPQTTRCTTSRVCTANHQQTRRLNHSICREVLPLCSHRGHEYLQRDTTKNLRRHAVLPHALVLPTIKLRQHGVYHSSSYCQQPYNNQNLQIDIQQTSDDTLHHLTRSYCQLSNSDSTLHTIRSRTFNNLKTMNTCMRAHSKP